MISTFDTVNCVKVFINKDLGKLFIYSSLSYLISNLNFLVYEKISIGYNGHFVVAYWLRR